jgi:hypothetical protein
MKNRSPRLVRLEKKPYPYGFWHATYRTPDGREVTEKAPSPQRAQEAALRSALQPA